MNAPSQPVQKQSSLSGPTAPAPLSPCPAPATERRETVPVPTSLLKHPKLMLMSLGVHGTHILGGRFTPQRVKPRLLALAVD